MGSQSAGCVIFSFEMGLHVLLYWPNIIGYIRIGLVLSAWAAFETPAVFVSLYSIFIALDGVDGWLARRLCQSSRFGAWLDVVVDNLGRGMLWSLLFKVSSGYNITREPIADFTPAEELTLDQNRGRPMMEGIRGGQLQTLSHPQKPPSSYKVHYSMSGDTLTLLEPPEDDPGEGTSAAGDAADEEETLSLDSRRFEDTDEQPDSLPGNVWGWLVFALEWCVLVCNHNARGDQWKSSFITSPQLIQAIMANGFRTPLGTWVVSGLHGLPLWLYGCHWGLLTHWLFVPPWIQALGTLLLAAGRLLALSVEIWCIWTHIEYLTNEETQEEKN